MDETITRPPQKTVRVWAVSDLHGIDPATLTVQPDGCDLAVIAGDLCPLPDWAIRTIDAQPYWLNVVLGEWAASRPNLHVVIVPGECDVFMKRKNWENAISLPPNVHLLIDDEATVCGLHVYGSPWTPFSDMRFAFMANSETKERQWFDCIPKGTDLLATHCPPLFEDRSFDVTLQFPTQRLVHHGSRALADAIRRVNPTLCVFGHVHTGDHALTDISPDTALRNVSLIDEDYRVAFRPAIIDVPIRPRPPCLGPTHPLS